MTPRVQKLLLGGLLLILGTSIFFELLNQPEPQHVPLKYTTGLTAGKTGETGHPQKLTRTIPPQQSPQPPSAFTSPRNIFAPLFSPPRQPKKTVSAPVKRTIKAPTQPTPPVPPSAPSDPNELAANRIKQELQQFTFLGYLTREGKRKVFLQNKQAIYIVSQGETFEGDIAIQSVSPTEVIISKPLKGTGITVKATLPLTPDKNGPNS